MYSVASRIDIKLINILNVVYYEIAQSGQDYTRGFLLCQLKL